MRYYSAPSWLLVKRREMQASDEIIAYLCSLITHRTMIKKFKEAQQGRLSLCNGHLLPHGDV
jgi:hypothetical protein